MELYTVRSRETGEFVANIGLRNYHTSIDEGLFVIDPKASKLSKFIQDHPEFEIVPLRLEPTEPAKLADMRDYFDSMVSTLLSSQLAARKNSVISLDVAAIAREALNSVLFTFDLESLFEDDDNGKDIGKERESK